MYENFLEMKYFTIKELCASFKAAELGIKNEPTKQALVNLESLVLNILDPLRAAWGGGIIVTSGYRSAALNKAVGGSASSAHRYGLAADIVPADKRIGVFKSFCVKWLKENAVNFDQYIDELSIDKDGKVTEWVHIGIKSPSGKQRRQFLKCRNDRYEAL